MYGTLGPERTVWDEEAHESTKKTIKKQKESKYMIMGSVLVIILSISEQLQMKRLLVLTVVGLRHQRREHILILHSVSFSQDFEP